MCNANASAPLGENQFFFALQVLVLQRLLLYDLESAVDLESDDAAPTTAVKWPS